MLLGQFKFDPVSLRRSKEHRWHTIECIEKTSLQNIGSGIENIDLTGVIYPHRQNSSLEQLRNMRDIKEPNVLVYGSEVLGNFVITHIEERQRSYLPCGLPRKIEFQLKLKSYNK
ncbi:phage tail protein [Wolbachia endosymbiont of Listronotus oregonensis]|uniref:phage tail protein n=1 Tax=unclassified Wolbachia TaxID=2640676 RepID=UPI002225BF03|nr:MULTISPECIES: phage tail protein [unclassified Wolbachia]WMT83888.1 phage tail protein [Wolbachia endosymbiont of Listronotus oregonensis]